MTGKQLVKTWFKGFGMKIKGIKISVIYTTSNSKSSFSYAEIT
jgi:hypothetical protein